MGIVGFGKSNTRGIVGLDLDGQFLAAVQTSGDGVSRAVSTELAPGIIVDGEVTDVAALSEAIKDFFKAHNLPRRVNLGVSNQQIVVRHLELPKIENPDELAAAVRFQASEAIAMPLDEVVMDHQVVSEYVNQDGAARLRIVVDAFALVRTLALPSDSAENSRVYCHLGGVTNLAIALGSICVFTRPLSTVWDDDDQDIAAALAEEIRLSVDFYMAQPDARWVGEVVLSGPHSRRPGLAEALGGLIDVPVTVAEPLGRLGEHAIGPDEDAYRHTIAAGLALGNAA
jgi:Tfp pilus assembly PilM family ATPase